MAPPTAPTASARVSIRIAATAHAPAAWSRSSGGQDDASRRSSGRVRAGRLNSRRQLMKPRSSAPDLTKLVEQWQALGRQWADWWTHGQALSAAPALDAGNAALAVLTPAEAWIDPAAAAALTERYNQRFKSLWERAIARSAGELHEQDDTTTEVPDRRFGAPAWRKEPFFAWLKDAYLLYAEYVRELAELTQCDPDTKRRIRFLARQYADAIAPWNFLATNPEALALAIKTGGASVAHGLANLLADA